MRSRRNAAVVLIAAAVIAAALVAVQRSRSGSDAGGSDASGVKPPLRGLVDQYSASATLGAPIHSFVVSADWAELQLRPNGPIVRPNVIDAALADVRARGTRSPAVQLKLRVFAGIGAPEWAKHLSGEPFTIGDPTSGRNGTVGRFWTPAFGEAYAQFQRALAKLYDRRAEISEVTISRCTTVFAEPFLRQLAYPGAADAYLEAGYTRAADRRCHTEEIEAHRVWRHTRSGLALNPYQYVSPTGRGLVDESETETMMQYCRKQLGERCVLENNSIRWPPAANRYSTMYAAMKRFGPPIAFQTAAAARIGDPVRTVVWAIRFGASSVELGARANAYSAHELVNLDERLTANR